MLNALLSSVLGATYSSHPMIVRRTATRARTASRCHAPRTSPGTKLRNRYGSVSGRCRFDQSSNLFIVLTSIYSHLDVLTHGISSGNRVVFTNTSNADITMCILYIYIYYIYIYYIYILYIYIYIYMNTQCTY